LTQRAARFLSRNSKQFPPVGEVEAEAAPAVGERAEARSFAPDDGPSQPAVLDHTPGEGGGFTGAAGEARRSNRDPLSRRMSEVVPEEVDWLWHPYFPRGYLTSVEGDPGVSKSTLMCEIAARISRGEPLPGQSRRREPLNVLMLSAEDSLGATLHPRLVAQGADLTRVFASEELLTLDEARLKRLAGEIQHRNAALVVLDPIVAYMDGRLDIHRANAVRAMLAPLAAMAAKHDCAIVIVRHLAKARHNQALHRGIGSVDFTAAVRSALLVAPDKANDQRRIMGHAKCNLAPLGPSLSYRVRDGKLVWTGQSSVKADDLGKKSGTKQAQTEDFLADLLASGPLPHERVLDEATKRGFSERTLDRAKKALGVRSNQKDGAWYWSLPEQGGESDRTEDHPPLMVR